MSVFRYIRDSIYGILYFVVVLTIINLILLTGTSLALSLDNILYLNVLISFVSLFYFVSGYFRWRNDYLELKRALDKGERIEYSLPRGSSLESQLIRRIIESKNQETDLKVKALKDSLNEINDYIAKWVHEIKLPISVCELIAEDSSSDLPVKASVELKHELERIKFLINQVLYASRAFSYSDDLLVEEQNLERLVVDSAKRNASFFIAKGIDLQLHNLNYNVLTDKKWASYILDQILNNACKYVSHNGKISVSCSEDDKAVRLSIRDNGVGIPSGDINRIFDRGFTGNNGRKVAKSTGMGLYFSKKMVEKLGHHIEVSSKVDCYTEFTIVFSKISDFLSVTKM